MKLQSVCQNPCSHFTTHSISTLLLPIWTHLLYLKLKTPILQKIKLLPTHFKVCLPNLNQLLKSLPIPESEESVKINTIQTLQNSAVRHHSQINPQNSTIIQNITTANLCTKSILQMQTVPPFVAIPHLNIENLQNSVSQSIMRHHLLMTQ